MATHSSILAWRIPWTEEPGGYSPPGCKEQDTTERLHFHFQCLYYTSLIHSLFYFSRELFYSFLFLSTSNTAFLSSLLASDLSSPFFEKTKSIKREYLQGTIASQVAQMVKNLPARWETWVQSLGREDALEKARQPDSSILAWRIPWTEESGVLQSTGSQRLDTTERLTHTHTHTHTHINSTANICFQYNMLIFTDEVAVLLSDVSPSTCALDSIPFCLLENIALAILLYFFSICFLQNKFLPSVILLRSLPPTASASCLYSF